MMESDSRSGIIAASRRSFLQLGAAGSAALASGILGESFFAASGRAASLPRGPFPKDAVIIDANENPLGPCSVAREAIAEITGDSGRYSFWLTEDLAERFAEQQGLKPEYVRAFPGSGEPLHFSVLAFTSTARRYATADPGCEAGMHAAKISGARVVKTPRKFHAQGVGGNRAGTDRPRSGTSGLGDFGRRRETRNEALYAAGTNAETRDSNCENGR